MGMTMTQKILARHAGLEHVVPGQLVEGKLDLVLGNDITTGGHRRVQQGGADPGVRPGKDRAGSGSLHPPQGYQAAQL